MEDGKAGREWTRADGGRDGVEGCEADFISPGGTGAANLH